MGVGDLFYECNNLESVDLSSWSVTGAQSFNGMFYHCYKLKTVDISTWEPAKIKTISRMFGGCTSLETVDMRKMVGDSDIELLEALKGVKDNAKFIVNNNAVKTALGSTTSSTINFQTIN